MNTTGVGNSNFEARFEGAHLGRNHFESRCPFTFSDGEVKMTTAANSAHGTAAPTSLAKTWYQRLLGCISAHGGPEYERLIRPDGTIVLQLHSFQVDHHHGPIADPQLRPYGNGLLLWFEVDDFEDAVGRAEDLKAEVVMPRHRNPPDGDGGPNHWEIWLRDPDGYTVVLASPDGTADGSWKP